MENQHKKISGYRSLTQEEIDLMNEAKELEARCLNLHSRVNDRIVKLSYEPEYAEQADKAHALRWHSIARTDIETGFMALVRSIAQPQPKW